MAGSWIAERPVGIGECWDPSAAPAQCLEIDQNRTDEAICRELRRALTRSGLRIDVTCVDGAITLAGTVRFRKQKLLVERLVAEIPGVRAVNDALVVRSSGQA